MPYEQELNDLIESITDAPEFEPKRAYLRMLAHLLAKIQSEKPHNKANKTIYNYLMIVLISDRPHDRLLELPSEIFETFQSMHERVSNDWRKKGQPEPTTRTA